MGTRKVALRSPVLLSTDGSYPAKTYVIELNVETVVFFPGEPMMLISSSIRRYYFELFVVI